MALSLFKLFTTGGGLGSAYVTYAPDLDGNFTAIETLVNTLEAQLSAVQGPNALLGLDILQWDDPATAPDELEGVIGAHSYVVTINASPTLLNVSEGAAIVNQKRVGITADLVGLVGPGGGASTHFVALDVNGIPSIKASAGLGEFDIASATWSGALYTAVTLLAPVFFDGDDYADQQSVTGNATAGVPGQTHRRVANRFENIERLLRGHTANVISGGGTLGPLALIRGSDAAPGIITTAADGATFETGTGLFRPAANQFGASASGEEVWRVRQSGGITQLLIQRDGSDVLPDVAGIGDEDTGLLWPALDEFAISIGADRRVHFFEESGKDVVLLKSTDATRDTTLRIDSSSASMQPEIEYRVNGTSRWFFGVGGSPGFIFFLFDSANAQTPFSVEATAGAVHGGALTIRAEGDIDSLTQPRVDHRLATPQAITTGATGEAITFDTETTDVGFSVSPGASIAIPTSKGGWYMITAGGRFDEPASPLGTYRGVHIRVNGTDVSVDRKAPVNDTADTQDTAFALSRGMTLAAGDSVTLNVHHDHGSDLNFADAYLTLVKVW